MVMELPESAAHVATDPNRVYYLGAGGNSCLLPGLRSFFLTRLCLRPSFHAPVLHHMLDGLRQSLVRHSVSFAPLRGARRLDRPSENLTHWHDFGPVNASSHGAAP